ncbi:MAG: phytoene/squalene synthase family protein, partial [Beijerinckiaceae bacterium]
ILARGEEPGSADAAGHAGVAYAITGLLRAFPWHARRGQVFLPQSLMDAVGLSREDIIVSKDTEPLRAALAEMRARARQHLDKARSFGMSMKPEIGPAFLPLASVPHYLADMERGNYDPFSALIHRANWRRVWSMWRWRT